MPDTDWRSSMDLLDELQKLIGLLQASIKSLKITSTAHAEAERDYKILLRQVSLKLRDEGMAVGMIDKVVYGQPSVAEARFKRDVAEANYKANQEAINAYKLQIRILENAINREYGMEGRQL